MIKRLYAFSVTFVLLAPAVLMAVEEGHGGEHGGGHGVPHGIPTSVWFHLINLSILVFVLYRVLRKPLNDYLVRRQDTIRDALEHADAARREAEEKNRIYEQRLAGLAQEIATLKQETEAAARDEAAQIVASARKTAARVESDAQRLLNDELTRARYQLRQDTVELAIQMAQQMLASHITEADQRRLAEEYLRRVGPSTEIH